MNRDYKETILLLVVVALLLLILLRDVPKFRSGIQYDTIGTPHPAQTSSAQEPPGPASRGLVPPPPP